jgi:hypothetical protein
MKKITSLMLGLSLILGASAVFAQDKPVEPTKTEKKSKKKSSKKKKEVPAAAASTEKKN